MITKFTTVNALPEPLKSNIQTMINFGSEFFAGDFIHSDSFSNVKDVFRQSDYTSNEFLRNQINELIGKKVVRSLFVSLRAQNLTQAQEADLIERVINVLNALAHGFIRGARDIANALTVAGELKIGRKNFLLAEIDAAILEI